MLFLRFFRIDKMILQKYGLAYYEKKDQPSSAEQLEVDPGIFIVMEGDIEIHDTQHHKKKGPGVIEFTPYTLRRLQHAFHHFANEILLEQQVRDEQYSSQKPIQGGWFPHDVGFVMQQECEPAQYADDRAVDQEHLVDLIVAQLAVDDHGQCGSDSDGCGCENAIELEADEKQDHRQ